MKNQNIVLIFGALLAISQVCNAQIKCYVCDNCANVNKDTPVEVCDASFFEPEVMVTTTTATDFEQSSTPSTISTSTPLSTTTTTETTTETTTTTSTTTTPMSTVEVSTEASTTTLTPITENEPPTPPTVTADPIPTPPNGTVLIDTLTSIQSTLPTFAPPNTPLSRRRRQVASGDYTYHCYRVQHKVNNSYVVQRNCSRVSTQQSVCGVVQANDFTTKKCYSCDGTLCNGSTALGISAMTVLLAAVAALLRIQ